MSRDQTIVTEQGKMEKLNQTEKNIYILIIFETMYIFSVVVTLSAKFGLKSR